MPNLPVTVLVVDDEEWMCRFATAALQRRGYTVITATSALRGLRLFVEREAKIDLVISDVVMPEMSGFRMVEMMRQIRPEVLVIFVTGAADTVPEWIRSTCGFLKKPFSMDKFVSAVENCLNSHGHRARSERS